MSPRRRLDQELVRRELVESRSQAAGLIAEGRVLVGGAPTDRASRLVSSGDSITVVGPPPRFVGRGGSKLVAALEHWSDLEAVVRESRAVDCGASTGGFTDCLLQYGASSVCSIDVGRGQIHERIRADSRVDVRERTDIRSVDLAEVHGPFDLLVADLSFISLRTVAPALVRLCKPQVPMILLVKPQFEVGRAAASRARGVIADDDLRDEALSGVLETYTSLGCSATGWFDCPVPGAEGNREFLLRLAAPEVQG